jgi:hypothetical protein
MAEDISFEGEIIKLLDADPFVPFSIIVTSGDRFEVADPHAVAVGANVVVVVEPREGISFFRKNIVGVVQRQSAA